MVLRCLPRVPESSLPSACLGTAIMHRVSPPATEQELQTRAHKLVGQRLGAIAAEFDIPVPANLRRAKGWVGELFEIALGATAGSRPVPDFDALGIELKSVPLNTRHQPQETTFVCSAPLTKPIGQSWERSTVRAKLARVLWIPVEAAHEIPLAQRRIGRIRLWSPCAEDEEILRMDWEEHMEMLALGQLDLLDARLGTYLQLRPKALNSSVRTAAVDALGQQSLAAPKGFYLRTCFTRRVLAQTADEL